MASTRRQFLRNAGVGAVALSMGGVGLASAAEDQAEQQEDTTDVFSFLPESVSISADLADLETYQPYLQTSHLDIKPLATYGARFSSPDRDTDVYCYWTRYPWQTGLSRYDSHQGDREPLYVFVRSDGSIDSVSYSAWHWLAAQSRSPPVREGTTNVDAHVAKPHHHHVLDYSADLRKAGGFPTLKAFVTFENGAPSPDSAVQQWWDNGWQAVNLSNVLDPWRIRDDESWWAEDSFFAADRTSTAWARLALSTARLWPWTTVVSDI